LYEASTLIDAPAATVAVLGLTPVHVTLLEVPHERV
jgi:hypothetical protein